MTYDNFACLVGIIIEAMIVLYIRKGLKKEMDIQISLKRLFFLALVASICFICLDLIISKILYSTFVFNLDHILRCFLRGIGCIIFALVLLLFDEERQGVFYRLLRNVLNVRKTKERERIGSV